MNRQQGRTSTLLLQYLARVWFDIRRASSALYQEVLVTPIMTHQDIRYDVFLSFHGDEVLAEGYSVRDLARRLSDGKLLQHYWTDIPPSRFGNLSIFFDDTELTNRHDGRVKEALLNGLLQTRGGGLVAILATPGYFRSKWCIFEMMCALDLAKQKNGVNVCFIGLNGMTAKEIEKQSESARAHVSFHEKLHVSCKPEYSFTETNHEGAQKIAELIKIRCAGLVAGSTENNCRKTFVNEFLHELPPELEAALRTHFDIDGVQSLSYTMMRLEPHGKFIKVLGDFLNGTPGTTPIKVRKEKLEKYGAKWAVVLDWEQVSERLGEHLSIAQSLSETQSITQPRIVATANIVTVDDDADLGLLPTAVDGACRSDSTLSVGAISSCQSDVQARMDRSSNYTEPECSNDNRESGTHLSTDQDTSQPYASASNLLPDESSARPSEAPASAEETAVSASDSISFPGQRRWIVIAALLLAVVIPVAVIVPLLVNRSDGGKSRSESSKGEFEDDKNSPPMSLSTLKTILERGKLLCGVSLLRGRAEIDNDTGEWFGFSVDMCRAVAAAIFGNADDNHLQIVNVTSVNRFEKLASGEVDLLSSADTVTMERDLNEPTTQTGFTFSIPYLYDGLVLGGDPTIISCTENQTRVEDCSDLSICVVAGTTYVSMVEERFPEASLVVLPTVEDYYRGLRKGLCNVIAGDQFDIAPSVVREYNFFSSYIAGRTLYSKEPLALVTKDGDPNFSDFVTWIIESMFTAEKLGATQGSASTFVTTSLFGSEFRKMFQNVLAAVGNYAEIYERNLGDIVPRSEINQLNDGSTALIYSYPFGNLDASGPSPVEGGKIQEILQRGSLKCGISRVTGFGEYNVATGQWRGIDADLCRAVAAALGVNKIDFVEIGSGTLRFQELDRGDVDLLARVTTATFSRDVKEDTTGKGFTFSQNYFYDALRFGGIPPYGNCANNLDTRSSQCQQLSICYQKGTTFEEILKKTFTPQYLRERATIEEIFSGLDTGVCNAIAGGILDVVERNVRDVGGYAGPYQAGSESYSADPLALVTKQDDQQWSSFVFWILSALFYAEEEGISQSSASQMPFTNLFGGLKFSRAFRNVVEAVGSYANIYTRNVESEIQRSGANLLNRFPYTAQLYARPGLDV